LKRKRKENKLFKVSVKKIEKKGVMEKFALLGKEALAF